MKKLLGIIAIALFVALPISAKATIKVNFSCGEKFQDDQGRTLETCKIALNTTAGETITSFDGDLKLTNVTLDESSVKGLGAFNNSKVAILGTTLHFDADAPQTGETIEIGTFNVVVDTTKTNCKVVLVPTSSNVEKNEVTVDVTPIENPKTGSTLSYLVIGAGVMLVAGALVVAKKNTKMYKI